mgnify:CR=1 FL=1
MTIIGYLKRGEGTPADVGNTTITESKIFSI